MGTGMHIAGFTFTVSELDGFRFIETVFPSVFDRRRLWAAASSYPTLWDENLPTVTLNDVEHMGELDAEASKNLGGILADLIDGQGNMSLVVDLRGASAGDPDCLWMLTEAAERAHRRGGTMRLDGATEVNAALELRGLDVFVGGSATTG